MVARLVILMFSLSLVLWPVSLFSVDSCRFYLLFSLTVTDLFTCTIWACFVHQLCQPVKMSKKKYDQKYFQTCFAVCFPVRNTPSSWFSEAHVNLVTSCCRIAGFCIALCVVSALNSWAIQSKACISAPKYKRSPFYWSRVEIIFRLFSLRTK